MNDILCLMFSVTITIFIKFLINKYNEKFQMVIILLLMTIMNYCFLSMILTIKMNGE